MKIEFKNEQEKECLKYILLDWFTHNGDFDVLSCDPACRNESSPGCDYCIKKTLDLQLDKFDKLEFWHYGGEEWIMEQSVNKWAGAGSSSKKN